MPEPFFSVLITAYNRADELTRCLGSCRAQTFEDYEIVVVDDASTDGTAAWLCELDEPRLRVVTHERNRGISPARATAVDHARGRWLVMLDSDWELLPDTLARLRTVIDGLPPGVRMIRSRLRWDDGTISPTVIPEGVSDYHGRLEWLEAVTLQGGSSDAGHCIHRAVFEASSYPRDRRGVIETLWETDTARRERSLWLTDVLGLQHADAANSASRDVSARRLVPRLVGEAPDLQWMAEQMLSGHGAELALRAPRYHRWLLRSAALEGLLAGDRRAGLRRTRDAAGAGAGGVQLWVTLGLGMISPRLLAYAKVAGRQGRAWRTRTAPRGA